jgi:hypothetical protein
MGPRELLRWQWEGYPRYHAAQANLLLHVLSVPVFWVGTLLLVASLLTLRWPLALIGLVGMSIALVAQGRGHKLEATPPAPFAGPWNFVARFCLEQWLTFPRFVLSGGWRRAYRDHGG